MGSFAGDGQLCDADLALLAKAQRGDRSALKKVCRRFQTPLLAMAVQSTGDYRLAAASLDRLLRGLLEELLLGRMVAVEWPRCAALACSGLERDGGSQPEAGLGIEGIQSVPRVMKRRIVRELLPQLPLPELTALLLRYLDHCLPTDMAGLVADTPEEVELRLLAAHQMLQQALDERLAGLEVSS